VTGAVGAIKVRVWVIVPEGGHSGKSRRHFGGGV